MISFTGENIRRVSGADVTLLCN